MAEVLDPAGDKVSVLRSQIKPGSKITVRTMTIDGELSTDSGNVIDYSQCYRLKLKISSV